MSLRLYRAAMIGTGTRQDPWRPALRRYINVGNASWQLWQRHEVIPAAYALVSCAAAVHNQCAADPDVLALSPERASVSAMRTWLAGQVGALSAAVATAIEADGIPLDDIGPTATRAQLMRRIVGHFQMLGEVRDDLRTPGRLLAPWRHGTVGDVPADVQQLVNSSLAQRGLDASWVTAATPVVDVVAYVRTQRFEALAFCGEALGRTLAEVLATRRQRFRGWMEARGIDATLLDNDATTLRQVRKYVLAAAAPRELNALGVSL